MIRPLFLFLGVCLLAQSPQEIKPAIQASGLNPLPVSRDQLVTATKAQEIPNTKVLDRAWALYAKWQGTWRPDHTKPSTVERQEVLTFTSSLLEKLPGLAVSENLGKQSIDVNILKNMVVVGSPEFKAALQSEGTQTLKALVLMGLTLHELDSPDGVKIAHPLLIKLLQRTPLDPDLYFLYARLSIDAQQKAAAWQAARTAIFMRPDPSDNDLEFVSFIASQAAKDQWPAVQLMLKEVSTNQSQAERVIQKAAILFTDKAKSRFTPLPSNAQTP